MRRLVAGIYCDNQLDCITADDAPSMIMENSPMPVKNKIRTRSGQVICRLVRLGTDIQWTKRVLTSNAVSVLHIQGEEY